ncbi:MAG: type I 3-dehydroquinate dehydratase [Spirochaetaceae bacterium]|jgi:3-dehydroquinate dehydratase/shikimate dehydrogenase|nr:type I 3-dehydroquinate dehydratase [Spirochaetaceae bacterium]
MTKICLCLTGTTIQRDLEVLEKYRKYIDMAELRVDYLTEDEYFHIRRFPELAGLPVILTVRRKKDGGQFERSESSRIILLSKGLAFAKPDKRQNFAYVDMEEDIDMPSLEEAARTFGTRIIRSFHNFSETDIDLITRIRSLSHAGDEIVKAAVTPTCLEDVTRVFRISRELKNIDKIIVSMGDLGHCTRVLSSRLGSYLTYTMAKGEADFPPAASGQLDPKELVDFFRFRNINNETKIFGLTGYPITSTASPQFFNSVFARTEENMVYLRFPAESINSFIDLANEINIEGASVTVPHKETVLNFLATSSDEVRSVGACNTIVRTAKGWSGFNTDTRGFSDSLLQFIGKKNFKGMAVTIIGAGGAARAIASELFRLKAKVLIVNRSVSRAEKLAQKYNFEWNNIDVEGIKRIKKFSNILIQTTSVGMEPDIKKDPLPSYRFTGKEIVMDIIYKPERTHFLNRAANAGCRVLNGFNMLTQQAKYQYFHFFNTEYPETDKAN